MEALRGLARNLPLDVDATYIVAQHMAPHHKSLLSEIIGRETDIEVLDVTDKLVPKANAFYITPPNRNIIVEDGCLRLVDPSKEPGAPKPSVDTFFKSLAAAKGEFAIGIILSGTGSDGSKGIKSIRDHGGITVAQDDLTAKYSGMPVSAIQTGFIDLVMSPEEIGAQIAKITALPRDLNALRASPLSLDGISELIQLLMDQKKVNFRHYKTATFQRRIERRMAAQGTNSLEDYVTIARNSEIEVESLFKDLLISVTSFFRDAAEFDSLKQYISTIIQQKPKDHIRVWVPGTATGEEAYSLAILFSEAMEANGASDNSKLQIFATDIDLNAIEVARKGFYSQTAVEQIPEKLLKKYFDQVLSGFTVKKSLREKMVFSYHNIAQDPPFLKMDMISCRNLLIYFQANLQAEVFSRFHYSLVPHGLLFLGRSEAVAASEALFTPAGHDKHIFFQRPSHERRAPREMVYERPAPAKLSGSVERKIAEKAALEAQKTLESLIKNMGKCAILIDSKLNMVRGYGNLDDYIGVAAGSISTKATSLLKDPYKQDIQAIVPSVLRTGTVGRGFERAKHTDIEVRERLTVYPVHDHQNDEPMVIAVFEEWKDDTGLEQVGSDGSENSALHTQIRNLSHELAIAKTNLQQTVEELETSNEELQAYSEELQSSNEELQSTNEELETSNEELQSTNEELSTVNEELHVNAGQLSSVNQNLSSILNNITLPLLVVDRSLNITNASASAEDFFSIIGDLNLPHISRCAKKPGFPNLVEALNSTLDSGEPQHWQITHDDYSGTLKIVPHFSHSNELMGAIIIVNDDTEELRQAHFELELMFENVPVALMVRDANGKIIQANSAAVELLGKTNKNVIGTNFYSYFPTEIGKRIEADDHAVVSTGKPMFGDAQLVRYGHGKEIWARMSRIPAEHPKSSRPVIYAVTQNITEQQKAVEALKESELRLDQAVRASNVGYWEWDVINDTVFWSDALLKMLQTESHKLNGGIGELVARVHPNDLDAFNRIRDQHFEDRGPYHLVYRLRTDSRKYIWVEAYGQAIWDEDGQTIRFTGTIKDESEKKRRDDALREQKEQLEQAASLSGIGHWKIDLLNEELYWSEQVHLIHGTDKFKYVPDLKAGIDFYHPEDLENVERRVNDAIENATSFEFSARIFRADGELRSVRAVGTPDVSETGQVVAVFGVFQDITEEKIKEESLRETMEELARSNEELNRFSYVCSHDMKEPVRMIESMAALLIDPAFTAKEDKKNELLKRISTNTNRLRDIIDSLLAYSRIDAKVDAKEVDLDVVLSELLDGLTLVIEENNAKIELGKMPVVHGAPVHFTQLFHNLIANAIKFTDKIKCVVRISSQEVENGWTFLVEDNGPGIAPESREEIFNIFSRLQRRDEVEGTGLGLSIAQRIVLQYGGTLKCCDTELGGVGFEIYLPSTERKSI